MTLEWQQNQNGTYFAEVSGDRYSVKRIPGCREWALRKNGEYLGLFTTKNAAFGSANICAERSAS